MNVVSRKLSPLVAALATAAMSAVLAVAALGFGGSPAHAEGESGASCAVEQATLTWGFKESWRAYIDGSIANGSWTVADGAEYSTPNFSWATSTGSADLAADSGSLSFTGSVRFVGHGGILDTTVANPTIEIVDADSARVLLDVTSKQEDGSTVQFAQAEFGTVDLSAATVSSDGQTVTIADAPAALTADGASAFSGYYAAGETLDPITLTYTLDAGCGASESASASVAASSSAAVTGSGDEQSSSVVASESTASNSASGFLLPVVIAILVVAVLAALWWFIARRRRGQSA